MARLRLERSGPWIGTVGLACLLWLDLASLLFAPWWGVALMLLGWVVAALLVLGWARPHPRRAAWAPLVGLAVWATVVVLGATVWDWP